MRRLLSLVTLALAPLLLAPTCTPSATGAAPPVVALLCDAAGIPAGLGEPPAGAVLLTCDIYVIEYGCDCNSGQGVQDQFVAVYGHLYNQFPEEVAERCTEIAVRAQFSLSADLYSVRADCFATGYYTPPGGTPQGGDV
jgi:hypothetical protein